MRTTPKVRRATGIVFATVVATSLAACGVGVYGLLVIRGAHPRP